MNNKLVNKQKEKGVNASSPSRVLYRSLQLERIFERYTTILNSTVTTGASNASWVISPAGLLLGSRLTGYQALRDQIRIDKVVLSFRPIASTSTSGLGVLYIERDPSAAVVGNFSLALDQFEVATASSWQPMSLTWRPQQPSDREFQNLNPGTVSLGTFFETGAGHGAAALPLWEVTVKLWATLRGRP
jgi:hypothetical protein